MDEGELGQLRAFKDVDLRGGTLVVGIPNMGIGSSLVADHLLEAAGMDHVAGYDHPGMEPVAMVYAGKARFPVRIHADAATRTAVLGSETAVEAGVLRDLAHDTVDWCRRNGIVRIVALDTAWNEESPPPEPEVRYVSHSGPSSDACNAAGLKAVGNGVLAGLAARLLLEARIQDFDVVGLISVVADDDQDVQSAVACTRALARLVPGIEFHEDRLRTMLKGIETTVRELHEEGRRAVAHLGGPEQYV